MILNAFLKLSPSLKQAPARFRCLATAAANTNPANTNQALRETMHVDANEKKWKIVCSSIVERLPIVQLDREPWEVDYYKMKEELDYHRQKHFPQEFWSGLEDDEDDGVVAHDDDEMEVGAGFQLAPRVTKDDLADNRKSLNRALQNRLFLIVKKDRSSNAWQFPQGVRYEGEPMRDAAVRELVDECGETLEVFPVGNAPIGHFQYEYPKEYQQKTKCDGAHVFFYKSQYMKGDVHLSKKEMNDYMWVTKKELEEYLEPEYFNYVKELLPLV